MVRKTRNAKKQCMECAAIYTAGTHHDCSETETLYTVLSGALKASEQRVSENIGVNKYIAGLLECALSHFQNNDRAGALAIINAIQFALQKS